jgi:hypothetical protein
MDHSQPRHRWQTENRSADGGARAVIGPLCDLLGG